MALPSPAPSAALPTDLGAYGLVVEGLPAAADLMQPQLPGAPTLRVVCHPLDRAIGESPLGLTTDHASLSLAGGGRLRMARSEDVAHYHLPAQPPDEDLLHPYFTAAAALYWQWRGYEAMHAGAVVARSGAILVLGEKESGKSTTLGWLTSELGVPVLADDLAVVHGDMVLPGPRSVDLRVGGLHGCPGDRVVRDGGRRRMTVRDVAAAPLAGVVVLTWSDRLSLSEVPVSERLPILAAHRAYTMLPPDPMGMLELARAPMVRAARPHDLAGLPAFGHLLMARFD